MTTSTDPSSIPASSISYSHHPQPPFDIYSHLCNLIVSSSVFFDCLQNADIQLSFAGGDEALGMRVEEASESTILVCHDTFGSRSHGEMALFFRFCVEEVG